MASNVPALASKIATYLRRKKLRAIPTAVRVWTLPLGVKTIRSPYHPDHPQHYTSCARAMVAHYPGVDLNDLHHAKGSSRDA